VDRRIDAGIDILNDAMRAEGMLARTQIDANNSRPHFRTVPTPDADIRKRLQIRPGEQVLPIPCVSKELGSFKRAQQCLARVRVDCPESLRLFFCQAQPRHLEKLASYDFEQPDEIEPVA